LTTRKIGSGSILLALILALAQAASAQTPPVVTRVVDGNTIIVSAVGSVDGKTGPKTGSAFAVHSSGKLLTNNHVVEGCSEVTVSSAGGDPLTGRIQARDVRNDLALIALNSPLSSIASFRRTPIRSGEDVIALGFPLNWVLATDLNASKGIVSATAGLLNDATQLQISAGIHPGNSGGPLLDSAGLVVGIVASALGPVAVADAFYIPQDINFAIKAEIAEVFLGSQSLDSQVGPIASASVSAADIVERARRYTFLVECDAGRQRKVASPLARE